MARDDDDREDLPATGDGGPAVGDVIDFGQLAPAPPSGPRSTTTSGALPPSGHLAPTLRGRYEPTKSRARNQWVRWLPIALAACVGAAIVVHVTTNGDTPATVANPTPPAMPSPTGSQSRDVASEPVYFETPRPILGITDAWELFGYGGSEVVRIQFGDGGITRTTIPPLQSSGPVSFAAGEGWAMVRPLDGVPGYLVLDRAPAKALPTALDESGPALPGPDADDVWIPDGSRDGRSRMSLINVEGRAVGPQIWLPDDMANSVQPDGAGYLLAYGAGGVYSARPDGLRRITTGLLLAAGAQRWLTLECSDAYACALTLVDRLTGAKHPIAPAVPSAQPFESSAIGVVSPDSRTAAILENDGATPSLHLIDLTTAADRKLTTPIDATTGYDGSNLVFSPNSHWLFVAGESGVLYGINAVTGGGQALDVVLPPLQQLVMRDASK
jgi:hypothetical protein